MYLILVATWPQQQSVHRVTQNGFIYEVGITIGVLHMVCIELVLFYRQQRNFVEEFYIWFA
jgi:hypothetical protein